MAAYGNFRSSTQIDSEREAVREARKKVLEKAKNEYERSERKRAKARDAGEGTWMLASVTDRIEREQKAMEKVKKKKAKKEKKKKKKHKKEKKKRQDSFSESESSDGEDGWVEKGSQQAEVKPVSGPSLQRDSWMESPLVTDIIPTVTREQLRQQKRGEEEKKKAEAARLLDEPGQHTRELNPYWKDGGCGLPENKPQTTVSQASSFAGDGGLSWLRKAYQRCQQQAEDEGRSLEDVAAERYGSLEKLQSMIREAESAAGRGPGRQPDRGFHGDNRAGPHNRDRSYDREGERRDRDGRDRRDRDSRESDRSRNRDDGPRNRDERDRDRYRDERDRDRDERDRDRYRDERDRDRYSKNRDREHPSTERENSWKRRQFVQPDNDDTDIPRKKRAFAIPSDNEGFQSKMTAPSSFKGRFAKPTDSDEDDDAGRQNVRHSNDRGHRDHGAGGRSRGGGSGGGGWKKTEYRQVEEGEKKNMDRRSPKRRERGRKHSASASSGTDSGSLSSSSGSESSDDEQKEGVKKKEEPQPVRLLSEDEMNSLGAKILRAELMGDEDLAKQLKTRLEQARKAKEAAPQSRSQGSADTGGKVKDKEDDVVVLTRTGKDGMVRPLPEQEFDHDRGGKKRRKIKNVETHGKAGERTRYFDDDSRHDLKTLVQMEKLGTAEDQNAMFARLAGRGKEQTDDDFQVDDMFLSRAARQQSGAQTEEKERSKAIFEHRKVSAAMDKCQYCFNNIPKHLLIAIGNKVYLSLPAHRSLTPGHCLIVPMQHVSSATALDEDVWQEMQTFRKQLVQMFMSQDEDVVFMETSMHLRRFPHMVWECIPLEKELGDMAPIYFKKAIQDAGPEWSNNKKVVDISQKDIRRAIPKGFPYFSVDFGLQGGFAHVIEEEATFPSYFGREIVGGMIDAEPSLWRKPHREGFEDQRRKVLEFEKMWKPFDFTA